MKHIGINTLSHHDRIRSHSSKNANRKIDIKTIRNIRKAESLGSAGIIARLEKLDREWDIDRVLMLNFSVLVLIQLFAARKNKKWLWGPLLQTPFLLMHSTAGWCPPTSWFRPLGIRTKYEIQAEREELLRILYARELAEEIDEEIVFAAAVT